MRVHDGLGRQPRRRADDVGLQVVVALAPTGSARGGRTEPAPLPGRNRGISAGYAYWGIGRGDGRSVRSSSDSRVSATVRSTVALEQGIASLYPKERAYYLGDSLRILMAVKA